MTIDNFPILLRKIDNSVIRLLNKYDSMITTHHTQNIDDTLELVRKALKEGNGIIILQEYLGYSVNIFKNNLYIGERKI